MRTEVGKRVCGRRLQAHQRRALDAVAHSRNVCWQFVALNGVLAMLESRRVR